MQKDSDFIQDQVDKLLDWYNDTQDEEEGE